MKTMLRKIAYYILLPFAVIYISLLMGIMYIGKFLYVGANWASGYRIDKYEWNNKL